MIKKAFGCQTEGGWGRGGEAADHKFWPVESSRQASAARIPGSRRSKESSTHSSRRRRRRRRDIPPTSPGGALRCVFQVWSKIRNPPRVQFSHRLCRQCAERAFSFSPRSARQTFPTRKKIYRDIRERLSNLALLRFLPHSLCFAVKKVSHRVENPREGLRVRLSL